MSPTQFDTPKALPQVVISHWRRLLFARTATLLVISMALASGPARADIIDAAATCDPAQLRAELAAGSDANAVDEDGNTVLHWAARNSGDACVEILNEHVLDLDARNNDGETALMKAAISSVSEQGALRSVQLLIDAGADPSIPNRFGYSPLFAPVVYGSGMMLMIPPSELQLDPETGIPPFKDIEYEMAKLLLDNGANPNEFDTHGQPLIQFAVEQRTPALIDLLVSRGADLTVLAPPKDHSMLHIAALRDRAINIPYLLKQGLDIDGRNALGATPLMLAAANSSMKSMSALLEAGADTDVADNEGITPYSMSPASKTARPCKPCSKMALTLMPLRLQPATRPYSLPPT
ncbi:ankyrin repeat domain-containing protein (plasmid) [Devosia sp. A8/3-2]|nr:ankyrin repeat domain-containing protein [Devosia sp. A8/3-2]